jgi:hypothetical protein
MKPALLPRALHLIVLIACCCAPALTAEETHSVRAGDLELGLGESKEGISLQHLSDAKQDRQLASTNPLPLFTLKLRQTGSSDEVTLNADQGWRECSLKHSRSGFKLAWGRPTDDALAGISVTASAARDSGASAFRWRLRVENKSTNWSVWHVVFPQVALADLGTNASVLFPRGSGQVETNAWSRPVNYRGTYPEGWCSMQFMSAYTGSEPSTGFYLGMHDRWGSTKEILLKSEPTAHVVRMSFDHPAPDMGRPGNGFVLEGEAVWQLLRGDWFDAARIYRTWAKKEAKWWPHLSRDGRNDTPAWMRQLNVWAMTGGAPGECVPPVKNFREFLGLPLGFHWYTWHQIPFDNDYPHYFPAKEGFTEGVAELRAAGVFPMPYINGRLWDSHDRGADDYQFTNLAWPSVTKKPDGTPYLETYGSKETNGQPVRLGVMCPSTPLWQNTMSNIVLRLLRDCGTSGVYIDQVAAAAPKLCMDRTHGHPLGGGHWWTESYWKMLDQIRRAKPSQAMLTTECNSEPFIRWFDGYLTWHWQNNGQVPAFPAVYGGTVQMFGRAYRGGSTKDLALRMKAGQQLVFGEQLGWLDPGLVQEPENAAFFHDVARLRSRLSRYFFAGEMARPPKLIGEMPQVKADWQWSGEWWVTTDAVLTGAWKVPRERRLVLLFVNVSDRPVTAAVSAAFKDWGVPRETFAPRVISAAGLIPNYPVVFDKPLVFPARQATAWELSWY